MVRGGSVPTLRLAETRLQELASITAFPIVPDFDRFPEYGRDLDNTFWEIGIAGHWIKS